MPARLGAVLPSWAASDRRVAYTLEQCWHDVPGGTAVAAIADRAPASSPAVDVDAGRRRRPPPPPTGRAVAVRRSPSPSCRSPRPWLYETWLRVRLAAVSSGRPARSTSPTPPGWCRAPSRAPLVVTVHDLAFVRDPSRSRWHGRRVMRRSLEPCRAIAAPS